MKKSETREAKRPADLDEAVLAARAQGGDEEAFAELARRYTPLVYSIARARLANADAAEELTQEVLLRIYLTLPSLRASGAFPGWVRRVARNLASDWQRRGRRRSHMVTLAALEELSGEAPDRAGRNARDAAISREENSRLQRALDGLPVPLREVVVLRYLEGLSQPDAARKLGLHPTSVHRRLDRALAELRTALEAADVRPEQSALTVRCLSLTAATAALSESARAAVVQAAASGTASASASGTGWFASFGLLQTKLASATWTGGLLVTKTQAVMAGTLLIAASAGVYYTAGQRNAPGAGATGAAPAAAMPASGIAEFDELGREAPGSEFVIRVRPSGAAAAKPGNWHGGDRVSGLSFVAARQPFPLVYSAILGVNNQQVTGPSELKQDRYDIFLRTPPFDRITSAALNEPEVRALAARKLLETLGWSARVESRTVPQVRFVDPAGPATRSGIPVVPPPPGSATLERLEAERRRTGKSPGAVWGGPVPLSALLSGNYLVSSPAGPLHFTCDPGVKFRETDWWRRGQVSIPSGEVPQDLIDFIAAFYQVGYVRETTTVDLHRISKP